MKLNAPTQIVFLISLILAIVAILGGLGIITPIVTSAYWFAVAAWAVLAAGCFFKGV